MPDPTIPPNRTEEFLSKLESSLENPTHKRLIRAYAVGKPVLSMELELAKILQEIIDRAD
jgi:hypothetical protein